MKAHKIKLYVGAGDVALGQLEAISEMLNQTAGGHTMLTAEGSWFDPDNGQTLSEPSVVFEAVITRPMSEDAIAGLAWELAGRAAWLASQKSVLYVITPVIAGFAGPQREN